MKISYNWLRELIQLNDSPEEIGSKLTGTGLEVESIEAFESIKGGLAGIVVGQVKTCAKHPNADKLSVTTVDLGTGTDVQIVCGAPNVAAGQKVLVATVGATVYPSQGEPFGIKKSKIRGEVSEGMICAEDELGLGHSHDGILVLPETCEVGKPASTYFPIYSDYTIEIGLTANRGDAASHLGVARDLRALTGNAIQLPNRPIALTEQNPCPIKVELPDADCIRYSGLMMEGITVKDSPEWLKNRLKTIGLSPINNIVDATNYVLHEMGQPLHAFDASQFAGNRIVVKKAIAGSTFTTLDKMERKMIGHELLIWDAEKPLAIAGVFGGLDSGISANTHNIFLESASFDAASVRKTAKAHGLSTDASFRYERGTDPNITVDALKQLASLILDIAGGTINANLTDVYPAPVAHTALAFSIQRFHKLIGQPIPMADVKRILAGLDIEITHETDTELQLLIPPYRSDVKREADVTEEILRIYGLNNIDIPTQVKSSISPSADEQAYKLKHKTAEYLTANGFYELTCNSLTKSAYYSEEKLKQAVSILNPLSNDLNIMRMSMVFSGLEVLQYNQNRRFPDMKCYEFGLTYITQDGKYVETPHLSLFITGNKQPESWNTPQQPVGYFSLKTAVQNIFNRLGIKHTPQSITTEHEQLQQATTYTIHNKEVVTFGSVKAEVLKQFDLNQAVYMADFNWKNVVELCNQSLKFTPISAFPWVRRDLALELDKQVTYADIERIALKAEPNLLQQVNVFDVYEGDKIASGKKSYALSFVLQDNEKTLTDQEIERVMNKLVKQFEKELNASLRS